MWLTSLGCRFLVVEIDECVPISSVITRELPCESVPVVIHEQIELLVWSMLNSTSRVK